MTKGHYFCRMSGMNTLDNILDLVQTPGRYLPMEMNAVKKDLGSARVKIALCFPDAYEVGFSHLGVRILYHLINDMEGMACDRAYAPWTDMENLMRREGIPLCSHESGLPLRDFDVVGFSLTYELCYTNVLNILDLSGVPLKAADREEGDWPLVLGGGPCASNPEPVAPFFDAFLFGDGEEAVPQILETVARWKEKAGKKRDLLEELSGVEGVYIPSFFEPEYNADGTVKEIRALKKGYESVKRRIVSDLDSAYFPEKPMVPVIEPVHDRLAVEIARGCSRGCRFCHAGVVCRPVRERSPERIKEIIRNGLASTGYEECSLLSLSVGDYSCVSSLLADVIKEHFEDRVSISLPSLRVKGLSDEAIDAIESVKKTGFTLAPEAGTERLRRVINKDFTEEELIDTAERVFARGWLGMKLYFMVGLPTETDEDVDRIARLANRIASIKGVRGKPRVTLSLSGFVPKPHTPFQWEGQLDEEGIIKARDRVRDGFRGRSKKLKWHDPAMTALEGVFSRGDRRLARVLLLAHEKGRKFDGWSDGFDKEAWAEIFSEAGVDPTFYNVRERGLGEVFPWDRLDARVDKEWLLAEREKARREERTPDCAETGCVNSCGVCDHRGIRPERDNAGSTPARTLAARRGKDDTDVFFVYRLRYARRGPMRFMGQLEVIRLYSRAVRRAGIPIRYSQGFTPLPRIKFGPSPPVGVASEAEYVDLDLTRSLPEEEVKRRMGSALPEGIEVLSVESIPAKSTPITAAVTGFDYVVIIPPGVEAVFMEDDADKFMALDEAPLVQKREKGEREVDIRSRVKYINVEDQKTVKLGLKVVEGPGVKPLELIEYVFGVAGDDLKRLQVTRLDAKFMRASPIRYSGKPDRTRRGPSRGKRRTR